MHVGKRIVSCSLHHWQKMKKKKASKKHWDKAKNKTQSNDNGDEATLISIMSYRLPLSASLLYYKVINSRRIVYPITWLNLFVSVEISARIHSHWRERFVIYISIYFFFVHSYDIVTLNQLFPLNIGNRVS